jgi:hypothetical protein
VVPLDLAADAPVARAITVALQAGDVGEVERLLSDHPELARSRIAGPRRRDGSRTPLHIYADWPANRPRPREIVALLVSAGADVDAPYVGRHAETALHWAASSDDVELIDALLDAGANLEAPGAVIGGGTPLDDATAFGQWQAARLLVARGARTGPFNAAALGLVDRLVAELDASPDMTAEERSDAFWGACHGGQQATAAVLLERGAELNRVAWDALTPLDAAERSEAHELVAWLRARGGKSAAELDG